MKLLMFLVMTVSVLNLSADPVIRLPRVSEGFVTNLNQYKVVAASQTYPDHFVPTEGQWSNSASSVQGSYDYFVVRASVPDGARILRMSPIGTTYSGMSVLPTFTDVLTGEIFTPSIQTQDIRSGPDDLTSTPEGILDNYFQYGSLTVGQDVFNVFIAYDGTPRYPTVSLTWGEGSDLLYVGTILDTFENISTEAPATETRLVCTNAKDVEGLKDGLYLAVSSPKEFGHIRVEMTTDFKTWSEVTMQPFVIIGDIIAYEIPPGSLGFFRAIEP